MRNIIEDTVQLVIKREESSHIRRRPTIRRVPSAFRDSNARFYTPRMVSIGPLHRGDEKLQEFERQKADCVRHLLAHCRNLDSSLQQTFEECLQKVSGSIDEIKACYAESEIILCYSDDELAKMMVIDACFILCILYKGFGLIGDLFIGQYICYDLLLIENQIPFFVLEDIFRCTFIKFEKNTSLVKLLKDLLQLCYIFNGEPKIEDFNTDTRPDHILGFAHALYQPAGDPPELMESPHMQYFHTATELDRSGVNFHPNHDPNWAMAIKVKLPHFSWFPWFCYKPLFKMPLLKLYNDTELVLRNLIMYEQLYSVPAYLSAYVVAMDELINTPEDVRVLKESKVLINHLGSDEMVTTLMNNIAKYNHVPNFFYKKEFEELDDYYSSYWPSKTAELKRIYFKSPWTMIALVAAFVLFVLTLLQTIYSIK